jgi:hypothetical protein
LDWYGSAVDRVERPIIVCGPARGGTTAVWTMLNHHAEILIGREVPLGRLPSLRQLLAEIAAYHGPAWTEQRRAEVARELWLAVSRPLPIEKPGARRWGMKTPWAELDRDLWDPLVNPLYVYCLRRGDRVFQSHIRLGWGIASSPPQLVARYKESLRVAEAMHEQGTAHIVQLDLARDGVQQRDLAEGLFRFLGESIDSGVEGFVDEWPTRPWTKPTAEPGEEPELPSEWRQLLAADDEYQGLMASHGY